MFNIIKNTATVIPCQEKGASDRLFMRICTVL